MKGQLHTNGANGASQKALKSHLLLVISSTLVMMPAQEARSNSVPAGNKPTPDPSPYERRVALPKLLLLPPGQQKAQRFEPKLFRLSMVCLLGSWNKQSEVVHRFYQKYSSFFGERKIASVAAFSHDTSENLEAWVLKHKPSYLVGLAQTEFVDSLKNPKVPSCWLLSRQGQILKQLTLPKDRDFESVYHNLNQWTDF